MKKFRDRRHDVKYYGWQHQKLRRALLQNAVGSLCVRCGKPIAAGDLVELDHKDGGAWNEYKGLAHRHCNRRAGALFMQEQRQAAKQDPEPVTRTQW
jgi:hypothetical protein